MRVFVTLFLVFVWSVPGIVQAQLPSREMDPQQVIDDARKTLAEMAVHPDYEALLDDLKTAKGVLIFPRVIRGGFFVGGSGGLGVFMAWDEDRGDYSPVAFYSIGSVSIGLQFGAEVAEVVVVARTQNAVDSLFATAVRLGGDASVAAGPVGMGRRATITADFLSYARSQGAFIGMSLEGSMLRVRDDFNESYYGQKLRPVQIIEARRVDDPRTQGLRDDLLGYREAPAESAPAPVPQDREESEPPRSQETETETETEAVAPGSGGLTVEEFEVENI